MTKDEVELKFLDVNKQSICSRVEKLGATKVYSLPLRSVAFDAEGYSVRAANDKQLLRVRQIGEQVHVDHKGPNRGHDVKDREETFMRTDDFEQAITFFKALGFTPGPQTTKHRTHYELGDVYFEIDEHEGLPPYLEIEAPTKQRLEEVCEQLGLDPAQGEKQSVTYIYPEHFGY